MPTEKNPPKPENSADEKALVPVAPKKKKRIKYKTSNRQCTARVKTCRNCETKFEAGDETWNCAICGEDRQCINPGLLGKDTCRVHGSSGGRPSANIQFLVPEVIQRDVFDLLRNPELNSMIYDVAVLKARSAQIMRQIHELDARGMHSELRKAAYTIEQAVNAPRKIHHDGIDRQKLFQGLAEMNAALLDIAIEQSLWREYMTNVGLRNRIVESERKFLDDMDDFVPKPQVVHSLSKMARMAIKYMPVEGQKAYAKELRGLSKTESALV